MTAQRASKKGRAPGMPGMHQAATKRKKRSRRSLRAAGPVGWAREWGRREPPG